MLFVFASGGLRWWLALLAGHHLLDERLETMRHTLHNLVDQLILLLEVVEVLRGEPHGGFLTFFLVHKFAYWGVHFDDAKLL